MKRLVTICLSICLLGMTSICVGMSAVFNKFEASESQEDIKKIYPRYIPIQREPLEIVYVYSETPEKVFKEILEDTNETTISVYPVLPITKELGKVQGPQEVETYYNLPMENVIQKMREMGYIEVDYPYYIREDGVRMLGDFIMVAADLNKYPKGTVVQTSVGQGMVCDTYEVDEDLFDIAVEW